MDREQKSHPSYGRIVLTKPRAGGAGGGAVLFGSKVRHPNYISMEIEQVTISEDGFGEFIHGVNRPIVRLSMSEAQWAHMVSSFGDGSGTPVTITARQDVGFIESPPEAIPVIELAKKTANETKRDLVKRLRDLEADVKTISSTGGGKKAMAKLAMDFNILASWLDSNFDYLENQVKERMEKEVAKANIEIEALISNAVQRLGQRALGERLATGESIDLPKLLNGDRE